jgi:Ion channel
VTDRADKPRRAITAPGRGHGRHRYGAVLLLTLGLAVYALNAPETHAARLLELCGAGAVLVVAVVTSQAPAATRWVAGAGLTTAVVGAALVTTLGHPRATGSFVVIAVLVATSAVVILAGLARLVGERGVVLQVVLGALAVYVLVGLVFGFAVGAAAAGVDGSYFASHTDATQSERVYYSFTVLTTTGFGDLTAATRAGRGLAVLEMLLGQLYLVTVIATLVGNLRR